MITIMQGHNIQAYGKKHILAIEVIHTTNNLITNLLAAERTRVNTLDILTEHITKIGHKHLKGNMRVHNTMVEKLQMQTSIRTGLGIMIKVGTSNTQDTLMHTMKEGMRISMLIRMRNYMPVVESTPILGITMQHMKGTTIEHMQAIMATRTLATTQDTTQGTILETM